MKDTNKVWSSFISEMNVMLKENDTVNGKSQKTMLIELMALEKKFKTLLLSTHSGPLVYEQFMNYILDKKNGKGNKLSVRPFLRERQNTFSHKVFPILDRLDSTGLHKFRINYVFAKWALNVYTGMHKKKLKSILEEMEVLRTLLCENNLPLAISRAKLFWANTPKAHLEYMDLIQDASRGLIEAIDNFVPPYRTVFRSVAIGRMGLNMSDDYSATLVKLPPKDKRILYRARKAKLKDNDISGKDLQSFVQESFSNTTSADIQLIEAAVNQIVNIDETAEGAYTTRADMIADPSTLIDKVEFNDTKRRLLYLVSKLKILERKILLMKTGELYTSLDS